MGSVRVLACLLIVGGLGEAAPVPVVKPLDGDPPVGAMKLLKHRNVQKELRLSAEQRIAILDGVADIEESIDKKRQALSKLPNATPDRFEKLEKEHRDASEKFLKTIAAKLLTGPQRLRLQQIDRQIRGPAALTDAGHEKLLRLTDKQKKAVEEALKTINEKTDAYLERLGNDDSDTLKEDLVRLRQDSIKSLTATLTPAQREVWQSLLGEPVKGFSPIEMWFTVLEENDDTPVP
jgi:hypothetical protein